MNQAVNFFWTILCFIPVIGFWLEADLIMCYFFIGASAISLFVPTKILQLSNRPKFYERVYVKQIRKFVQNGDYVNSLIRKSSPDHKTINAKGDVTNYLKSVKMYERYHVLCFVFFLLTTIYAVKKNQYGWASALVVANIIYNVCPVLLQQYNQARVSNIAKRLTEKRG